MDMKMQAKPGNYYLEKQILGIPDIGYFAGQQECVGSARQKLSRRKN
jgi:hypothetical protein